MKQTLFLVRQRGADAATRLLEVHALDGTRRAGRAWTFDTTVHLFVGRAAAYLVDHLVGVEIDADGVAGEVGAPDVGSPSALAGKWS